MRQKRFDMEFLPDSVVSFPSRVPNASSLLCAMLLLTSLYLYHDVKPSFASFRKECCLLDEEIRNKKKNNLACFNEKFL